MGRPKTTVQANSLCPNDVGPHFLPVEAKQLSELLENLVDQAADLLADMDRRSRRLVRRMIPLNETLWMASGVRRLARAGLLRSGWATGWLLFCPIDAGGGSPVAPLERWGGVSHAAHCNPFDFPEPLGQMILPHRQLLIPKSYVQRQIQCNRDDDFKQGRSELGKWKSELAFRRLANTNWSPALNPITRSSSNLGWTAS